MPFGTRRNRAVGCAAAALLTIAACGAPQGSGTAPGACIATGGPVVRLAWSQRGQFLAVGFAGADGEPVARVLNGDLSPAGTPATGPGMLAATVVVSAAGELAWLAASPAGTMLVEERAAGDRTVPMPPGVLDVQWTAIGYALLQRTADGRTNILMLDPERPDQPTLVHQTFLSAERLWASADPEHLLLSGRRDGGAVGFVVVGPVGSRIVTDVPGADLTGASMPSLRRHIVYHSTATSTMVAVLIGEEEDLDEPVVLDSTPAVLGAISDTGVLAFVPAASPTSLCRADVVARLPAPVPG